MSRHRHGSKGEEGHYCSRCELPWEACTCAATKAMASAWADGRFTPASTANTTPHAVEDAAGKGGCDAE
jgi:hypothetical protein